MHTSADYFKQQLLLFKTNQHAVNTIDRKECDDSTFENVNG
jgi:hypothetical protein